MLKRSLSQLLGNSKNCSKQQLFPKPSMPISVSSSQVKSTRFFPSSVNTSFLGKTLQPQKKPKRLATVKSKTSGGQSLRSSHRGSRDLSSSVYVHPSKRLRVSQVKPVTLGRYTQAVHNLEQWALKRRRSLVIPAS